MRATRFLAPELVAIVLVATLFLSAAALAQTGSGTPSAESVAAPAVMGALTQASDPAKAMAPAKSDPATAKAGAAKVHKVAAKAHHAGKHFSGKQGGVSTAPVAATAPAVKP
jgi:hypothetical protein